MPVGEPAQIAEMAALAENLGYRRIWVADEGIAGRDVYISLAAVAQATHTAAIGPGITNPFLRHPAITASAIATLDELSNGRAFCGLGAGGGLSLGPLAVPRHKPVRSVAEMIDAMRALWADEIVNHEGVTLNLRNARLANPPAKNIKARNIEIHLAARGPQMVKLASQKADGFYISYIHKDFLGNLITQLRSHKNLHLSYSTRIVTNDDDWHAARRDMTFRIPDSPPEVHDAINITPTQIDAIRTALSQGGPDAATPLMKDDWVAPFVIAGTPDECRTELAQIVATHKIDDFVLNVAELNTAPDQLHKTSQIIP